MLVKVLKAFPYHPDPRTQLHLVEGDIANIDESVLEGLEAEGFIGEASAEEIEAAQEGPVVIAPPVEIPADWRTLKWFEVARLAKALGAPNNVNKEGAFALIETVLAQRAAG